MKGIQFIVDDQGEKTAVVIDLEQWGQEWDVFYNFLLTHSSSDESWLNQSTFLERLKQALEWNRNYSPQLLNLEVQEIPRIEEENRNELEKFDSKSELSEKKLGVLAKIKKIKIQAPTDFAANIDLYLNGEKNWRC